MKTLSAIYKGERVVELLEDIDLPKKHSGAGSNSRRGYQIVKRFDNITLAPNQYQALSELRRRLFNEFDIEAVILYGSVARGEADEESDLDLLIVTAQPFTRPARHEITDMVFEVNLLYGTNFSTLVVDRDSWEVGVFSVLPLREEIIKDGIRL